jgi:hypothetical protein
MLQSRLDGGEYEAADAFARDVRLTFTNAMRYNEAPDHVVHIAASSLLKAFNERYEAFFTPDGKVSVYRLHGDRVPCSFIVSLQM